MPDMLPFPNFWAAFLETSVEQENCERIVETVVKSDDSLSLAKQIVRSALTETEEPIFNATLPNLGHAIISYTLTDTRMPGTRPIVWIDHVMVNGEDMVKVLTPDQTAQLEKEALDHATYGG